MQRSIYEFPDIFRRVHMEQPGEIEAEVAFLLKVWKRHLKGRPRRVLDIASGNSPHGQILARGGIEVVGIDRSPTMIAAGRRQSRGLAGIRFYRRAIEKFRVPERPFDVAFLMSETFPIMTTNAALLSHLESVGRCLRRGGLYCVDIDRHEMAPAPLQRALWRHRRVYAGATRVDVREYQCPAPWHLGLHSIYELQCTIHLPGAKVRTCDVVPVRYTVPNLLELAALASRRFRLLAAYADYSFTTPLEHCDRRWLAVMRRV